MSDYQVHQLPKTPPTEANRVERLVMRDIDIETLIENLRQTDPHIETIYTHGGCFRFHLFIRNLVGKGEAWINKEHDHVITRIDEKYYDITGEVHADGYYPIIDPVTMEKVRSWSFTGNRLLVLKDCPDCGEPITA